MAGSLTYRIIIEKKAQREASSIHREHRPAIDLAISDLATNPRPSGCRKLTERDGYRIRQGDYRILYTIDDKNRVVVIYRIKHRGESTYK